MDLTLNDVADLLRTSPSHVVSLFDAGVIPGYKLHDEHKFNSDQIEDWLLSQGATLQHDYPQSGKVAGWKQFCLYRAINNGGMLPTIMETDKKKILEVAAERIAPFLDVDVNILVEFLLDRENLMSTAVGNGIALPHARECVVKAPLDFVFLAHLPKQVEWGALDKKPVSTLFFIFSHSSKRHLTLLGKIAHLARHTSIKDVVNSTFDKKKTLESVKSWEASVEIQ